MNPKTFDDKLKKKLPFCFFYYQNELWSDVSEAHDNLC